MLSKGGEFQPFPTCYFVPVLAPVALCHLCLTQMEREREREIGRQGDREMERERERGRGRDGDRETERQTERDRGRERGECSSHQLNPRTKPRLPALARLFAHSFVDLSILDEPCCIIVPPKEQLEVVFLLATGPPGTTLASLPFPPFSQPLRNNVKVVSTVSFCWCVGCLTDGSFFKVRTVLVQTKRTSLTLHHFDHLPICPSAHLGHP